MPGAGDNVYLVDSPDDVVDETGGDGNDTIRGSISIDLTDTTRFKGDIENVVLLPGVGLNAKGDALDNVLIGNSAGNTLDGGLGGDFMRGLGGNDSYYVDDVGDVVDEAFGGSSGVDTVFATISVDLTDTTRFKGAIENVLLLPGGLNAKGNAFDNALLGNSSVNRLDGGLGGDLMRGLGGNDRYYVDDAGDVVDEAFGGSSGSDTVFATISVDLTDSTRFKGAIEKVFLEPGVGLSAKGNALDNVLIGNSTGNTLDGGPGADFMRGYAGNDTYYVDNVGDVVEETPGRFSIADQVFATISIDLNDTTRFRGGIEQVTLLGADALTVIGNAGSNIIIGNAGNNTLTGGGGLDQIDGGAGARDTASYRLSGAAVSIDLTRAVQTGGDAQGDRLTNIEDLVGSAFTDTLIGDAGDNWLDGGDGGNDTLRGGLGNDAYFYKPTFVMDETGGDGIDTVFAGVSVNLSDTARFLGAIENAIATGSGNVNLTGNGLRNALLGNNGNNVLDGQGGIDRMRGFAGNDIYVVDNAGDVVDEGAAGSGGVDTIRTAVSIDLSDIIHVKGAIEDVVVASGASGITVTGNALANVITGNTISNILKGDGGDDVLYGLAGADTLVGGDGKDTIVGGFGADSMRGLADDDVYGFDDAGDVVDELFTGSGGVDLVISSISVDLQDASRFKGAIENVKLDSFGVSLSVVGNALDNLITGSNSSTLNGREGNDTLDGGRFTDGDTFVFDTALDAATNVDTIISDRLDSKFVLENAIFTALDPGVLTDALFKSTADGPIDANDRIIYDAGTGALFYDVNGSGAGGRTQFAVLTNLQSLSSSDFTVT